jgi:hypothetical protein
VRRATALLALVLACGGPPPPPPSAVITADPARICQDDDYATLIHLDGKASAPRLTLVATKPDPSELPLKFHWSFAGSALTVEDGDVDGEVVSVRARGDRPLHVTLRVENRSGGSAESQLTIPIVVRDASGGCTP